MEITATTADDAVRAAATESVHVRSRSGGIELSTTPAGLPTAITLDRTELSREPDRLAAEILALCRQATLIAGIRLREELGRNGFDAESLTATQLPTLDDLARAERAADLAHR